MLFAAEISVIGAKICHPERSEGPWFPQVTSIVYEAGKNQYPSLRSG